MATDLKQQRRLKFQGVFEKLRDELVDHLKGENMPAEAVEWYRRVRLLPVLFWTWMSSWIARTSISTSRAENSTAG